MLLHMQVTALSVSNCEISGSHDIKYEDDSVMKLSKITEGV
jgi:hypothetical protein